MSILLLDNLDDRREIWQLLHRLAPPRRVDFLRQCCAKVPPPRPRPAVARMAARLLAARTCGVADRGITNEIYYDLLYLSVNHDLDLGAAAVELEAVVSGRPSRLLAAGLAPLPGTLATVGTFPVGAVGV